MNTLKMSHQVQRAKLYKDKALCKEAEFWLAVDETVVEDIQFEQAMRHRRFPENQRPVVNTEFYENFLRTLWGRTDL